MAGIFDRLAAEKQLTEEAVRKLRAEFRKQVKENLTVKGESKKATVTYSMRQGRLDRIAFRAPYYVFMNNFGFEGRKSNSVNMRLKAINVVNKALQNTNVLDKLVDDIAEQRGNEVLSRLTFTTNGE